MHERIHVLSPSVRGIWYALKLGAMMPSPWPEGAPVSMQNYCTSERAPWRSLASNPVPTLGSGSVLHVSCPCVDAQLGCIWKGQVVGLARLGLDGQGGWDSHDKVKPL